jgi:hypothetical protein
MHEPEIEREGNKMSFGLRMAVASVAAAGLFACGGQSANPQHQQDELGTVSNKVEMAEPIGTFDFNADAQGDLSKLVLMTDGRFHAEQFVACIQAPCEPAPLDGTFERMQNGFNPNVRHLNLYNSEKVLVASYEYAYDESSVLSLRGSGEWFPMNQAAGAWCGEKMDCGVQGMLEPTCEGHHWHCEMSACEVKLSGMTHE